MIANTFFKPSHQRARTIIGDQLKDIEHFRTYDLSPHPERAGIMVKSNTAVVVLHDGRCYVGKSYCAPMDTYNPSRGYEIALGRALRSVVDSEFWGTGCTFFVYDKEGRALRNAVKEELERAQMVTMFNAGPQKHA